MTQAILTVNTIVVVAFSLIVLSPLFQKKDYRLLMCWAPVVFLFQVLVSILLKNDQVFYTNLMATLVCFVVSFIHAKLIVYVKKKGWSRS